MRVISRERRQMTRDAVFEGQRSGDDGGRGLAQRVADDRAGR